MTSLQNLIRRVEIYSEEKTVNLQSYLNLGSIEINSIVEDRENVKRKILEKTLIIMRTIQMNENLPDVLKQRYIKLEKVYKTLDYKVRTIEAELLYRGLVGTNEGFGRLAFDFGLCWDSILQLPFFPSSSIKGATRVIADAVVEGNEDIGMRISKDDVERIFGYSEEGRASMGTVIFHDAYPVKPSDKGLILEPEVITPIYKGSGEEHLASPNPISFLTIARGVKFNFLLASKSNTDLNIAEKCLKRALEYGIGAKTLIGYSIFKVY
ncbi:type III-B CRISPR module RAMP protein Cmr6 [Candidatus Bathyarchaeota archaeon]|nr:MAG: type III-B CRISPR module RAMP protein Cmr6 [Candidatus Bathyarchaeota archaeon]